MMSEASGDTTPFRIAGVITSTSIDIGTARGGSPVLLSEVLLAHDVHVCIKRPSGALPPEVMSLLDGLRIFQDIQIWGVT